MQNSYFVVNKLLYVCKTILLLSNYMLLRLHCPICVLFFIFMKVDHPCIKILDPPLTLVPRGIREKRRWCSDRWWSGRQAAARPPTATACPSSSPSSEGTQSPPPRALRFVQFSVVLYIVARLCSDVWNNGVKEVYRLPCMTVWELLPVLSLPVLAELFFSCNCASYCLQNKSWFANF